jgi:molybdopterin biosynthesis enzyme
VSQRVAAGSVPSPLQPGTAARIFTGATVPEGADAVLMQETADALLERLGRHEFEARAAQGRALSDDAVVDTALEAVARARDLQRLAGRAQEVEMGGVG